MKSFSVTLLAVLSVLVGSMETALAALKPKAEEICSFPAIPRADYIARKLVKHPGNGWFYGITTRRFLGRYVMFRIRFNGEFEPVHVFQDTQDFNTAPSLELTIGRDGHFYGVINPVDEVGVGSFYKLSPEGVYTSLGSFGGGYSVGKLTEGADGEFYTLGDAGGTKGYGRVIKVTSAGVHSVVASFASQVVRRSYWGQLTLGPDGNFYGLSNTSGVPNDQGSVFRMTPSGLFTRIAAFDGGSAGQRPFGDLLLGPDGNFYGLAQGGWWGNVFKVTPAGVLTNHYSVPSRVPGNIAEFKGLSLDDAGNLCLVTESGIYRISPEGTATTFFEGLTYASTGIVQGDNGLYYGIKTQGGHLNLGSFYSISAQGAQATVIDFGRVGHYGPRGSLTLGPDGDLYGMTSSTVQYGMGSIFRLTSEGELTTLVRFGDTAGLPGTFPRGHLTRGNDGAFYGMTSSGGGGGDGSIFKMTPEGVATNLVNFSSYSGPYRGYAPVGSLLLAADGFFYGTTYRGGISDSGTVFKMSAGGAVTELADFTWLNGRYPVGSLGVGPDGYLYGMTSAGGSYGYGTIYQLMATGAITTVVEFTGDEPGAKGASPCGSLILGSDGNGYGMTQYGGASDMGTVFRITPTGQFTTLVEFTGMTGSRKGAEPRGSLTQGPDGRLYGMTSAGGTSNLGVAFALTTSGSYSLLLDFKGSSRAEGAEEGAVPLEGHFITGADGHLYGMTSEGGSRGGGSVFRLNLYTAIAVSGNGVPIVRGNNPPLVSDNRDFGRVKVEGSSAGRAFTLSNQGTMLLNLGNASQILFSGEHAGDFSVSSPPSASVQPGVGTGFGLLFNPSAEGLRTAQVTITSSDVNEAPFTFNVQGYGTLKEPELQKPSVRLATPTGKVVSQTSPLLVAGTASDNVGVAKVEISLNGAEAVTATLGTSAKPTAVPFTASLVPVIGANTLLLTVEDTSGNIGTLSYTFTFERRFQLSLVREVPAAQSETPDKVGTVALLATPAKAATALVKAPLPQTAAVLPGTVLKVTATARPGYLFSHWEELPEDALAVAQTVVFTMPERDVLGVKAVFVENPLPALFGSKAAVHQGLLRPKEGTAANIQTTGFVSATLTPTSGSLSGKVYAGGAIVPFTAVMRGDGSVWFKKGAGYARGFGFQDKELFLEWTETGLVLALNGPAGAESSGTAGPMKAATADLLDAKGKTGIYTMALAAMGQEPPRSLASYPQGTGYVTLTLSANGTVKLAGLLADGSKITASSFLTTSTRSAFFLQQPTPGAATKLGSLSGTLVFKPAGRPDDDIICTDAQWFRPAVTEGKNLATQLYTAGWPEGVSLDGAGARYDALLTLQSALGLDAMNEAGNAILGVESGRLSAGKEWRLNVDGNKLLKLDAADETYTLTFNAKTGLMQGTFAPNWSQPAKALPKFTGLLIQKGTYKGAHGHSISNAVGDTDPESSNVSLWWP
ncbi:hypothetical protein GCM10023213_24540 [Prosthecobacter algae]|uniref:Bacterial repeat domain-containing protein n=1 Tax=Prosthecobacter algae TaxID=1144682 RepID=A0ABP9P686_9BACT